MHKTPKAPFLWAIPLFLSLFSVIIIVSITSGEAIYATKHPYSIGLKQCFWLFLGLGAMIFCYMLPLEFLLEKSGFFWFCSLSLVVLTLLPGIGSSAGGAARWLRFGPFSIQPSELLSLFLVIHIARKLHKENVQKGRTFAVILSVLFLSIFPVLLQPDLGSTILIFLIVMGMVVQAQGWFYPLCTSCLGLLGIIPLIVFRPYRLRRIFALLDPWEDPLDYGFQAIQGLIAFANGGLAGVGIGRGMQKLHYLPATHTDYILSSIGEEYGFIGTGTVAVLYVFFIFYLNRLFYRCINPVHQTLFWGMSLSLLLPMFINFGGVLNLLPLTGMPCPFLSYGGSSMVVSWAKVGFLLNLCYKVKIRGSA